RVVHIVVVNPALVAGVVGGIYIDTLDPSLILGQVHHDDYGPIWPISIAPWQVHLCAMRADNEEVRAYADSLYAELQKRGIEVIYDDRNVSAGFMFSDADLLGVPYRVIVSPRNIKQGVVEVSTRDKSLKTTISMETAADEVAKMVLDALQASQNV
ncbi:MAG: hypothetical protein IJB95_01390, partial [Clostridia bacterium]|nr:hypothetical protein [Clostridia bacterium]